jgi:hypothetical protein
MNSSHQTASVGLTSHAALAEEDRRFNERTKIVRPVVIRTLATTNTAEQLGTVIDLSRDGLYFTVRAHVYTPGMELHLVMPESKTECTCEVVRTEKLPNGSLGVGARVIAW